MHRYKLAVRLSRTTNNSSFFLFLFIFRVVFPTNSANWVHQETAVKTLFIGSRSRIQIYLLVPQEGNWLFARQWLLVTHAVGVGLIFFKFISFVTFGSQNNCLCLFMCVCLRFLQVTILRGKDGYGFTICSDSPVRVQAVDPGKFCMNTSMWIKLRGPGSFLKI